MEFCPGKGLLDFMNARIREKLTEPEILKIMSDISNGLACMHYLKYPLIHRDLKVENVLIAADGTFKLCDFGSATPVLRAPRNQQEFAILQDDILRHTTPQYRSPEMIDLYRGQAINEKSDIWALGVFLYKLCYYTTPFEGKGDLAILHAVFSFPPAPVYSDRLKNLIVELLREDPNSRPNIYQVITEVVTMRNKPIPIPDIYGEGPMVSKPPSNSTFSGQSKMSSPIASPPPQTSYGGVHVLAYNPAPAPQYAHPQFQQQVQQNNYPEHQLQMVSQAYAYGQAGVPASPIVQNLPTSASRAIQTTASTESPLDHELDDELDNAETRFPSLDELTKSFSPPAENLKHVQSNSSLPTPPIPTSTPKSKSKSSSTQLFENSLNDENAWKSSSFHNSIPKDAHDLADDIFGIGKVDSNSELLSQPTAKTSPITSGDEQNLKKATSLPLDTHIVSSSNVEKARPKKETMGQKIFPEKKQSNALKAEIKLNIQPSSSSNKIDKISQETSGIATVKPFNIPDSSEQVKDDNDLEDAISINSDNSTYNKTKNEKVPASPGIRSIPIFAADNNKKDLSFDFYEEDTEPKLGSIEVSSKYRDALSDGTVGNFSIPLPHNQAFSETNSMMVNFSESVRESPITSTWPEQFLNNDNNLEQGQDLLNEGPPLIQIEDDHSHQQLRTNSQTSAVSKSEDLVPSLLDMDEEQINQLTGSKTKAKILREQIAELSLVVSNSIINSGDDEDNKDNDKSNNDKVLQPDEGDTSLASNESSMEFLKSLEKNNANREDHNPRSKTRNKLGYYVHGFSQSRSRSRETKDQIDDGFTHGQGGETESNDEELKPHYESITNVRRTNSQGNNITQGNFENNMLTLDDNTADNTPDSSANLSDSKENVPPVRERPNSEKKVRPHSQLFTTLTNLKEEDHSFESDNSRSYKDYTDSGENIDRSEENGSSLLNRKQSLRRNNPEPNQQGHKHNKPFRPSKPDYLRGAFSKKSS